MENASKALLMTGGIFIAIVILVIGVEIYVGYRRTAETYTEAVTMQDIAEINKQFEKYVGRTDITIQEVVTAARTAKDYNQRYGTEIEVKLGSRDLVKRRGNTYYSNRDYVREIEDGSGKSYKLTSNIVYETSDNSPNKGMVKSIIFTEVTI